MHTIYWKKCRYQRLQLTLDYWEVLGLASAYSAINTRFTRCETAVRIS